MGSAVREVPGGPPAEVGCRVDGGGSRFVPPPPSSVQGHGEEEKETPPGSIESEHCTEKGRHIRPAVTYLQPPGTCFAGRSTHPRAPEPRCLDQGVLTPGAISLSMRTPLSHLHETASAVLKWESAQQPLAIQPQARSNMQLSTQTDTQTRWPAAPMQDPSWGIWTCAPQSCRSNSHHGPRHEPLAS
jgi:hypothetical protein